MTLTGAQKYPGASTTYWYGGRYPGSAMESNVALCHTTEGMSLPSYEGGATAPNFSVLPLISAKKVRWYQHFDVDRSSRALVNESGGVQTNTANVCQVEFIGTCDPSHKTSWGSKRAGVDYIFWPDAPDWLLREVAKWFAWMNQKHGIKLQAKRPDGSKLVFKAYPGSYGKGNGVRLSGAEWNKFYGVAGHQHAPENYHGDPGNMPVEKILTYALAIVNGDDLAESGKDDDMPQSVILGATKSGSAPKAGEWQDLKFDAEYLDDGNEHAASSDNVMVGANKYTGSVSLRVTSEKAGADLQARVVEYDKDGKLVKTHPIAETPLTAGSTFLNFSVTGSLGKDRYLRIQYAHYAEEPVQFNRADVSLLVW